VVLELSRDGCSLALLPLVAVLPREASRDTSEDVELDFEDRGEGDSYNMQRVRIFWMRVLTKNLLLGMSATRFRG
jgi:hypothetical protein